MFLQEFDCTELGWILLWVPRLRELVPYDELSIELSGPGPRLGLGIVAPENIRRPFLVDEVPVDVRHFTFGLHSKDVDHVGL
jgi:hypothetical protein